MTQTIRPFLTTLDPTFEPITRAGTATQKRRIAAAPKSLSGLRIGLLANGKVNSEELLDAVCDELSIAAGVSVRDVIRVCKSSVSIPPTPEDMRRLIAGSDAVLVAVGD